MARPAFTFVRVAALIIRERSILLTPPWAAERGAQELWDAPGGGLEPGESLEDALRREAREEIGAEIEPGALAYMVQTPLSAVEMLQRPDRNQMSLEVCCFARLLSDDAALRPEQPFIPPPVWVPLEQVPELPTNPLSLRGWAKWVTEMGGTQRGVPVVTTARGAGLDVQYESFSGFWSRDSS